MSWTFYNSNGQRLSTAATSIDVLDIDGATDIGANIVDADLFIIDDGAGGTNRKTAASRIKTYAASPALQLLQMHAYVIADGTLQSNSHNVSSSAKDSTGNYSIVIDNDFDSGTYSILGMAGAGSGAQISFDGRAAGQLDVETWEAAGGQADKEFGCAIAGVLA